MVGRQKLKGQKMAIALHFNTLDYVEKAEKLGISNEVAKFQARQIEQAVSTVAKEVKAEIKQELHANELVTKKDLDVVKLELEVKIATIKSDLIKWILGTGIGAVITLSGVLFTLLKLMLHV
jgi:hypothetical protein